MFGEIPVKRPLVTGGKPRRKPAPAEQIFQPELDKTFARRSRLDAAEKSVEFRVVIVQRLAKELQIPLQKQIFIIPPEARRQMLI